MDIRWCCHFRKADNIVGSTYTSSSSSLTSDHSYCKEVFRICLVSNMLYSTMSATISWSSYMILKRPCVQLCQMLAVGFTQYTEWLMLTHSFFSSCTPCFLQREAGQADATRHWSCQSKASATDRTRIPGTQQVRRRRNYTCAHP